MVLYVIFVLKQDQDPITLVTIGAGNDLSCYDHYTEILWANYCKYYYSK